MSWWGKVIGGAFGMMMGGPLGAVLGAALGHNFDRGVSRMKLGGPGDQERVQSAFFTATFAMMGHIAKSDGRVSEVEISVARDVMRQMRLNEAQKKVAIRLFQEGKKDAFAAQQVLDQFRQECHRRRNLMQMFLEILTVTALADGTLHPQEDRILRHCAETLGFGEAEYQAILSRVQAQQQFHRQSAGRQAKPDRQALAEAYQLLGVTPKASDAEVKKAYRRLMNQHHPDKLVAKGLPQEMMDMATEKTQDIRNAYDLIKNARKS